MNRAFDLITSEFPRAPALLFCGWIGYLVAGDILAALGFVSEQEKCEGETSNQNVVAHYVMFQSITLDDLKIEVGSRFPANDGSPPQEQWCYITKPSNGGSHNLQITLATKDGNNDTFYLPISRSSAEIFELSPSEVQDLAKTHCNFI